MNVSGAGAHGGGRTWRSAGQVMLLGIGVAVMTAACGNLNTSNPLGPTAAGPATPAAHSASARVFKATISPTTVAAGAGQTHTVRITNCDTAACSSTEHSGASQTMKSATIQVPAGFVVDGSTLSVSISDAGSWDADLVGTTIQLTKVASANLGPGAWVEVTFDATAPCTAGAPAWTTTAFNGDDFTTAYSLFGSQPSVNVTGSCAQQACSPGFWRNHPSAYTDALFEAIFTTGEVSTTWRLSDALDNPGSGPQAPQPNPNNANFIGTAAYLSAMHPSVSYQYSTAFIIAAVQAAHNGDPTDLNLLDATFAPGHVCPIDGGN